MSLILEIIKAASIAFAFLTTFPVPAVEWTGKRLKYFTVMIPLVGVVVGTLGAAFFLLMSGWRVSPFLRAVLMALFYLAVTGGLHMDGLMDTCDAFFSRRDRQKKLEILSDTHTGAFAVMACVSLLLLKSALFCEFFEEAGGVMEAKKMFFPLVSVPVFSRLGQAALFHLLPFARNTGLAKTLGAHLDRRHLTLLAGLFLVWGLAMAAADFRYIALPAVGLGVFLGYRRFCLAVFGGITGDLLGAFVELAEVVLLFAALFVRR